MIILYSENKKENILMNKTFDNSSFFFIILLFLFLSGISNHQSSKTYEDIRNEEREERINNISDTKCKYVKAKIIESHIVNPDNNIVLNIYEFKFFVDGYYNVQCWNNGTMWTSRYGAFLSDEIIRFNIYEKIKEK